MMKAWLTRQLALFERRSTNTVTKRQLEQAVALLQREAQVRAKPLAKRRRRRPPKSDAPLLELWSALAKEYFPEEIHLLQYTVYWSNRNQLRTLASCNIDSFKIRVARELRYPEHEKWLSPLLYHEMCHAVLGDSIRQNQGKTPWHGKEFRALERRHPEISMLDSWIKSGGWATAVRSHRGKQAYASRKKRASP